jgi:hypothetical protein
MAFTAYCVYACTWTGEDDRLVRIFPSKKPAVALAARYNRAQRLGTIQSMWHTVVLYYVQREERESLTERARREASQ